MYAVFSWYSLKPRAERRTILDSNATFWNVAITLAFVVILSTRSGAPVFPFSWLEMRRVIVNPIQTAIARTHSRINVVI
jgi:hypothetical protein